MVGFRSAHTGQGTVLSLGRTGDVHGRGGSDIVERECHCGGLCSGGSEERYEQNFVISFIVYAQCFGVENFQHPGLIESKIQNHVKYTS
jgi:hypothetical protein